MSACKIGETGINWMVPTNVIFLDLILYYMKMLSLGETMKSTQGLPVHFCDFL